MNYKILTGSADCLIGETDGIGEVIERKIKAQLQELPSSDYTLIGPIQTSWENISTGRLLVYYTATFSYSTP